VLSFGTKAMVADPKKSDKRKADKVPMLNRSGCCSPEVI
jgi:hypothetical protein